ncbi:unnamed protein product [Paramecium sonneborni]|uniref:Uncharacterized protein n=1 Tax=Paramecium sonneborni TaxID=65129 RepID=A0A8S1QY59_9CILI|nr:unnamed protein product [Paramecium sonneborni]
MAQQQFNSLFYQQKFYNNVAYLKRQLTFYREQNQKEPINLVCIDSLSFTIGYFVVKESLITQIQGNKFIYVFV